MPTEPSKEPTSSALTVAGVESASNETAVAAEARTETPPETTPEATPQKTPTPSRVLIRAKANSWIEVRGGFGNELLIARLLKPGEEFQVPNQLGLKLLTGNAGALEILVDGEAVPAIGDSGDIRRGVSLDPDLLKAGNAVGQ